MQIIVGVALATIGVIVFMFSLPRAGKTAKFVGTHWEAYIVVGFLAAITVGLLLVVTGLLPVAA